MSKVIIHDAVTGETIERPMTAEEEAQREADRAAAAAAQAAEKDARAAAKAAKRSAKDKLRALGLTADEVAALGVAD